MSKREEEMMKNGEKMRQKRRKWREKKKRGKRDETGLRYYCVGSREDIALPNTRSFHTTIISFEGIFA